MLRTKDCIAERYNKMRSQSKLLWRCAIISLIATSMVWTVSQLIALHGSKPTAAPHPFQDIQAQAAPKTYHCRYREYPDPKHHSGLPFLGDVFAADNGTSVYFVTVNKGGCRKEWQFFQEFHTIRKEEPHYFMCSFPDGSVTQSDWTHRKRVNDFVWTNAVIVIRCPIPSQFQHLVRDPSLRTSLTVSLHATEDLESNSRATGESHQSYRDIPVCHGHWPEPDNTIRQPPNETYEISLATRLLTSYHRDGFKESIVEEESIAITKIMVIAWLEYHLAIGIQQFYIFDSDHREHGELEQWLQPYMDRKLVTYVWFPPNHDCVRDFEVDKDKDGTQLRIGQYVTMNGALRRYSDQTKWMGHWDVDEYFVLPKGTKTIQELVTNMDDSPDIDSFRFQDVPYSVCNGASIHPGMLPSERARCYGEVTTQPKSIMKTEKTLYFLVHNSIATTHSIGEIPNMPLQDESNGFLAHFQIRPSREYDASDFSGVAVTRFTETSNVMDEWTEYLKSELKE
jgi:hypothetical protein